MKPVFMIPGQPAGIAASLALKKNGVVQDVSYSDLEHNLHQENQFTFERAKIIPYQLRIWFIRDLSGSSLSLYSGIELCAINMQ